MRKEKQNFKKDLEAAIKIEKEFAKIFDLEHVEAAPAHDLVDGKGRKIELKTDYHQFLNMFVEVDNNNGADKGIISCLKEGTHFFWYYYVKEEVLLKFRVRTFCKVLKDYVGMYHTDLIPNKYKNARGYKIHAETFIKMYEEVQEKKVKRLKIKLNLED